MGCGALARYLDPDARRPASSVASIRLVGSATSCAGDVERGAVIDRGADDRKAERDVDRVTEREQLDGNQTLIVIAGDHRVELPLRGAHEHGVAGQRPLDLNAARARGLDGGTDHGALFLAEQPFLSRMRIQAGDRQTRARDPESRQLPRREIDRAVHDLARQDRRHLRQRHVHGGEHDLERLGPEHHRDAGAAGEMAKQIGVALPGQTRARERELVDRGGGNGAQSCRPARRGRPRRSRHTPRALPRPTARRA